MCGEGVGQKRQYMFTKWRLFRETRSNNCQGEFSFRLLHLRSKYTFEDCKRTGNVVKNVQWKEMGFKVLKVTMSPRYIWTTRNRTDAQNKIFGMNALWSGEKVSCPPSTVLHVEVCNKTRRTYDLKLNALLIL